jgi:FkbM family methyltransferase
MPGQGVQQTMSWVTPIKNILLPDTLRPRTIVTGPFRGINLELSLHNLQVYLGLFERETYGWLGQLSKGIQTAIDIGAANGLYTLYFLAKTTAKVYAFEPNIRTLDALDRNLLANGLKGTKRLMISRDFLGAPTPSRSSCEKLLQDAGLAPGWAEVTDKVQVTQLDSMLDVIETPCLIKMDVDGGEVAILRGAAGINKMPGVHWIIETHSLVLENGCIELLRGAGFQTRVIPNGWWRVFMPERRPIPHNRWLVAWK